jgi:hypothetical protein
MFVSGRGRRKGRHARAARLTRDHPLHRALNLVDCGGTVTGRVWKSFLRLFRYRGGQAFLLAYFNNFTTSGWGPRPNAFSRSQGSVGMPYSKVDTALGNKKGSLLNYVR